MLLAFALAASVAAAPEPTPPAVAPEPVPEPAPAPAAPTPTPAPAQATAQVHAPTQPGTHFHGALEAVVDSFPSGTSGGAQDVFASFTPLLGFDGGDDFGFELGAALRLRAFDDPPEQRSADIGGVIRRADWDETSDYGQILRGLRIGREDSGFSLRAGPLEGYTLGHGHLISRYSNRENPDYHPSGAVLKFAVGPTQNEVVASDFLGARLFAAEVNFDLGRIIGDGPGAHDRYHAAITLAHDVGAAGSRAAPATFLHVDGDLALVRDPNFRFTTFAGLGSRTLTPINRTDIGTLIGISAEGEPTGMQLGGRLELRKQFGYFRQSFFGPQYEVSRFAGTGFSGDPLAQEQLPDGFSGYGEFAFASGPVDPGPNGDPRFVLTLALEQFAWGRTDGDVALALRTAGGKGTATVKASVVGYGVAPRYALSGEVRYRIAPAVYALGGAGTVFFPQPDGTLVRGFFAGGGAGVDFER